MDQVAAALWPDYSRAQIVRWIRSGELTLDAAVVAPKTRVFSGQRLALAAQTAAPTPDWQTAQDLEFGILHEDDDLLVINKPAGLVVHPGAGNLDGTLVNGLLAHRPALRDLPRAGIVHRLDKDTSGLLLVAATVAAHTRLVRDLAARAVAREYVAFVEGERLQDGRVDAPIGRDPRSRTRQKVQTGGRNAVTHVRVTTRYRRHCAVAATLETGRTHQIRVHLSSLGHPLVGDTRYGWRRQVPSDMRPEHVAVVQQFARQALHARELGFDHPGTGEPLRFSAPLPDDLTRLAGVLAADAERSA